MQMQTDTARLSYARTHALAGKSTYTHTHTHTDMCGASCTICLSHWSIMAMSYNGAGLMNSGGVKFWGWSRHGACVLIPSHGSFTSAVCVCVCVCKTSVSHSCHFWSTTIIAFGKRAHWRSGLVFAGGPEGKTNYKCADTLVVCCSLAWLKVRLTQKQY